MIERTLCFHGKLIGTPTEYNLELIVLALHTAGAQEIWIDQSA